MTERILAKKKEAEKHLATVQAEAQSLALRSQMGDRQAQQRLDEIMQQALRLTSETVTLHNAWMEAVQRQTQAQNFETEAAKEAKRQRFESLLNRSLDLAVQSDQHIAAYAAVMTERRNILMEAEGEASTPEERGRVSQLLNRMGPSWQMGHFGIPPFIEQSCFQHRRDYNTLAEYTRARLVTWGVAASSSAPTEPAAATKERVN
jgi:hypothetical protein